MGRPEESNFKHYWNGFGDYILDKRRCDTLRIHFRKIGFKAKCIRAYRLDNPYMQFNSRAIMVKDAISHNRMEIEVVIA